MNKCFHFYTFDVIKFNETLNTDYLRHHDCLGLQHMHLQYLDKEMSVHFRLIHTLCSQLGCDILRFFSRHIEHSKFYFGAFK